MNRLKVSCDVNITSDSDDLFEDNWFSPATSSFDGSSINSIPWAEDVVKQNSDEWDRIERIFYNEESTDDEKLRNEISEWTKRFPHLRITGEQAAIYFTTDSTACDPNYEETIAEHPVSRTPRTTHATSTTKELDRRKWPANAMNSIECDMKKCLRITSEPLLLRRYPQGSSHMEVRHENPLPPGPIVMKYVEALNHENDDIFESFPHSARLIKIPSFRNERNAREGRLIRINTATTVPLRRPLRSSVTLPSIGFVRNTVVSGRSISALITNAPESSFICKGKRRSDSE